MAEHYQFTPEQKAAWDKWIATRPPIIQDLARRFPPNKLFRIKASGHRVYTVSYNEDGTMKVAVSGQFNVIAFERNVFGIKPDDLEECELPMVGEPIGAALTEQEDVDELIGRMKAARAELN